MVDVSYKSIIQFEKVNEDVQSLHEVATLAYYQAYFGSYSYEELQPYLESFFSQDKLRESMSLDKHDYFLVKKSMRGIGFAQVNHNSGFANGSREYSDDSVEIFKLYLLQKYTGKGIGTRFMTMMTDYYGNDSYNKIFSTVWSLSPRALKFYKKNGFHVQGQLEYNYAGKSNIDLILKKEISRSSGQMP